MPQVRLTNKTKQKLELIKKELIRDKPEFEGMTLSANFLINRAFNYYLRDSPFKLEDE